MPNIFKLILMLAVDEIAGSFVLSYVNFYY